MKRIAFGGWLLAASMVSAQQVELSIPEPDTVRLDWQAIPGQTYRVLRATNLADAAWSDAVPGGIVAPNVTGNHQEPRTNKAAFFRIVKEDTDPPAVVSLSPADKEVAVQSNATVTVALSDETGIDESSIRLSVAGWEGMTTANPSITYADGTLVFTPPDVLGAAGETITNRLTVADTLGHALTNYTWSFTLERITEASSDFLPLTAPPEALIAPLAAGGYFRRSVPEIQPLSGVDEYHIVSVTSNTVIFSYSGAFPVIGNGTKLVSFDAAYPMYRIVSEDAFMVNPVLQQITVTTTNLALTALVSEGSLSGLDLTPVVLGGAQSLRTLGDLNLLHVEYGDDLSGEVLYEESGLKLWLPSAWWRFTGDVDVSLELVFAQLQAMEVSVSGNLSMELSPEVLFHQATSGAGTTPLVAPVTHVFGGMLGPVPVWVEVVMELNAGYTYDASVNGNICAGVELSKDMSFSLRLHDNQWTREVVNPPLSQTWTPISWQIDGEANAKLYLQPKLTVLVFSLAGPWLDIKPYVEMDGWAHLNPPAGDLGLYLGLSSTLGIESRIWYDEWGGKPEWELFNLRNPLWTIQYPDEYPPEFVADSPSRMVSFGQSITLFGHAVGYPSPSYTWYFNGTRITGANAPEYTIFSANTGHQGTYTVVAQNSQGSVQDSCYVTVGSDSAGGLYMVIDLSGGAAASSYPVSYLSSMPVGGWTSSKLVMRRIPAGTFMMGSPENELGRNSTYERQHQVILSKDYFIGVFEVSQRQWELVMGSKPSWFTNVLYYAERPVECVSYYDIRENPDNYDDPSVDWPNNTTVNANSFIGKLRAKTGLSLIDLPTEAQWEYACRAGTTTALNSEMNLTNTGSCPNMAELGRYFNNGGNGGDYRWLSPGVGTALLGCYRPNAWGLHDMHGNVWEWCLDFFAPYSLGTIQDPEGPVSGGVRVARGGTWREGAASCRSASRYKYGGPSSRMNHVGFRIARTLP